MGELANDAEAQKVRDWRLTLMKTFFAHYKAEIKPEDMPASDALFTELESYEMTAHFLAYSKIGKVMRHIALLKDGAIPDEATYNFRTRARALVEKWQAQQDAVPAAIAVLQEEEKAKVAPKETDEPDENTRLIAPVDEPIPQPRHAVDSDRMKERLGHIVRSKEGKMVNLHAPSGGAGAGRSASRDEEHSQSASSLSAPDPDGDDAPPDEVPAVRLVRGAGAGGTARGRAGVRRISPSALGSSARAQEEGGAELEAEVTPATPDAIQPVGSLSRSWGD